MEEISETNSVKRIALIGPESSGKTTLCMKLAEHYHTVYVPEYSRTYMEKLSRAYTYDDIVHCTKEQMKEEDRLLMQAKHFLFCDMELINYKVWFEDKFQKAPAWLEDEITKRKYDLYLLTTPDLPWIEDPVRENPARRKYFFDLYLAELEKRKFTFRIISREGDARFSLAANMVDSFFTFAAE
jgi:NadR type nicotinamide-nucleotide adenylyltransferase